MMAFQAVYPVAESGGCSNKGTSSKKTKIILMVDGSNLLTPTILRSIQQCSFCI